MSCDLTSGRLRACDVKAGIKRVFIGKWTKNLSYTFVGNTITSINDTPLLFETINANYTATLSHTDEGEFYNITAKLDLPKVNKTDSATLNILSELNTYIVLENQNNQLVFLGLENGLTPKISETSGGAKSSFNGYSIELKGTQIQMPLIS